MSFGEDYDPIEAYKAALVDMIDRGDTINMTDDDSVIIIIGRDHDRDLEIERRIDRTFHEIIQITDDGLYLSDIKKYDWKSVNRRFKVTKHISTVDETAFLPWHLVTDVKLRHTNSKVMIDE